MKSTPALLIATALLSTALTACGSPMMNAQAFRPMPGQMMSRMSQPTRAQNSGGMHAQYYNLILKTSYDPDVNGQHFGFDFGFVSFISKQGKTIDLDLRFSPRGRVLWVTLMEQGAPEEQREQVDQTNTARLAEIAAELRALGAGSPQDKANIARIANLLEHPPVRP
ncbi:MAG: hypothetical protein ACAI44_23605 [Candidatus Sericytochromatia bacterium]